MKCSEMSCVPTLQRFRHIMTYRDHSCKFSKITSIFFYQRTFHVYKWMVNNGVGVPLMDCKLSSKKFPHSTFQLINGVARLWLKFLVHSNSSNTTRASRAMNAEEDGINPWKHHGDPMKPKDCFVQRETTQLPLSYHFLKQQHLNDRDIEGKSPISGDSDPYGLA